MKRIAAGMYVQKEKNGTYTYFLRDGKRWRVTRFWAGEYGAEKQHILTSLARTGNHFYATLAMAVSATKGNRVS